MRSFLINFIVSILIVSPIHYSFGDQHSPKTTKPHSELNLAYEIPNSILKIYADPLHKILKECNSYQYCNEYKGYVVIFSTMVLTAFITHKISKKLPENLSFLNVFFNQLSIIGFLVIGAPIWERISSAFKKWSFDISRNETAGTSQNNYTLNPKLEMMWGASNSKYSINAQMSRNVINAYLISAQQNFYAAFQVLHDSKGNEDSINYAISQLAEAAIRMRILFAEIAPDDDSIALVVHASFTNHIQNPEKLFDKALKQIERLDPGFTDAGVSEYYKTLLNEWLLKNFFE